jgi:hypothetical protein
MIERNSLGHERGCIYYDSAPPIANPNSTHLDLFCECHHFTDPLVLENGTDIAWPAGWNEKQAAEWREKHRMARPRTPH